MNFHWYEYDYCPNCAEHNASLYFSKRIVIYPINMLVCHALLLSLADPLTTQSVFWDV